MSSQKENLKNWIVKQLKHFQVLLGSMLIGIVLGILAFGLSEPLIPQGLGVAIIMFMIVINIIYDYKRNDACSKCGKWSDIQRMSHIDKSGMLMPNGISSMRKFKCFNCGHTWTEFSRKARKSP